MSRTFSPTPTCPPTSSKSTALRILGIDPGTTTVGYGVVDAAARFTYVECGVIRAPAVKAMAARLRVVADEMAEIIEEFAPDAVAIETAYHGRNAASALKLGQARGALMSVATERGLPVFEYAPARIKQLVVGHGRATKEQIQMRVKAMLRMQRRPSTDAADALAIALCHGRVRAP